MSTIYVAGTSQEYRLTTHTDDYPVISRIELATFTTTWTMVYEPDAIWPAAMTLNPAADKLAVYIAKPSNTADKPLLEGHRLSSLIFVSADSGMVLGREITFDTGSN